LDAVIRWKLRHETEKSNRQIAAQVGVDHKTVSDKRGELEATGEFPQLTRTTGMDGKERPATRKAQKPATPMSKAHASGRLAFDL